MMRTLLFISIIIAFFGCEQEDSIMALNDQIVGEWERQETRDSIITLTKMRSLTYDEYGIRFKSDGTLTEIKNAGWCGTPPISYAEFEGSWELLDDSTILINSTFWGGDEFMEWKIVNSDAHQISYYIYKLEIVSNEEK